MTSLRIEYWINDAINKEVFQWNGNLNFLEEEIVELPATNTLWDNIDFSGGLSIGEVTTYEDYPNLNKFHVEITNPNSGNDEYISNNYINSSFTPAPKYPNIFTLYAQTNNGVIGSVSETSWIIHDDQGNPLYSWVNLPPNSVFNALVCPGKTSSKTITGSIE